MCFTELTKKALTISFNAHKEQVDKSGIPYVYHPYRIAEQMEDEYSICVALLHDVVEDTDITIDELKNEGFPQEVLDAIALMTHDDETPYFDYIKRIKTNPIAKAVKLADLQDNSNYERLEKVEIKDLQRLEKYREAKRILES